MPQSSFKKFLIPLEKKKGKLPKLDKYDQQALYLWDEVFKNDPAYQEKRKKLKVQAIKPELNEKMKKVKEKMEKEYKEEIWQKLGERCIECGKCTAICPTCFCFRLDDNSKKIRCRTLDSCFFHDFSQIGGGFKSLDTTAKRIYFWYYHKFVRIPEQYNLAGCVECGRCTEVCPVKIDLEKVLEEILG